jgi:hypothetical protein
LGKEIGVYCIAFGKVVSLIMGTWHKLKFDTADIEARHRGGE